MGGAGNDCRYHDGRIYDRTRHCLAGWYGCLEGPVPPCERCTIAPDGTIAWGCAPTAAPWSECSADLSREVASAVNCAPNPHAALYGHRRDSVSVQPYEIPHP